MPIIITSDLIQLLRQQFALNWDGIHGARHWTQVRENGLRLAKTTGAHIKVVEAFAFIHDACRICDGFDPDHGLRAAEFARDLYANGSLLLDPDELDMLVMACRYHTSGCIAEDSTIGTCWDADRLDLGRVGIRPDPAYLCTEAARALVNPVF